MEFAEDKVTIEELNLQWVLGTGMEGRIDWHLAAEWFVLVSLENYVKGPEGINKRGDK